MNDDESKPWIRLEHAAPWRIRLAKMVDGPRAQMAVTAVIVLNAVVLGLQTHPSLREAHRAWLHGVDLACLAVFVTELGMRLVAYGWRFWRSGWNVFDLLVVGVALVPGTGGLAVLRSLRVLRVLRLLTVLPQLRRVVAAFFRAIPGLAGVVAVMSVFFYTAGVLATTLFGGTHPQWFGTLGKSLYTLFQIMTLESWSMGIVRPVMESHPWGWAFFLPFIVIATFTILNLFIGIIVSTMQELGTAGFQNRPVAMPEVVATLERLETELRSLRSQLEAGPPMGPKP
jgi:voltage-gated sodium channel